MGTLLPWSVRDEAHGNCNCHIREGIVHYRCAKLSMSIATVSP